MGDFFKWGDGERKRDLWGETTLEGGGREETDDRGTEEESGRGGREAEDEGRDKEECERGRNEGNSLFTALTNICEKVGW